MFDFSSAGIGEGLKKMVVVACYVAVAGAITALIDWLGGLQIDASNYYLVAGVGVVNMALAGILKWVNTKK